MNSPALLQGPLAGVRVIEIAGIGALPFAGMLLADMGAEILRVETPRPRELQMRGMDPLMRGRGSLTLDLKETSGRDVLLDLLECADILVEALRPGKMEALQLGPEQCFNRAPWLVYGRATGWGQSGPLSHSSGHDPNYVGYTGAMMWLGSGGRPAMPPFGLVGDTAGGALYLVMGVLAALYHAHETGIGQVVDASIVDGTLSMLTGVYAMRKSGAGNDPALHRLLRGECPFAANYQTADGRFMTVCALEPSFYERLIRGLSLDPAALPDREDVTTWSLLRDLLAQRFASETRAHWEEVFAGTDACASPVLTLDEALTHPVNADRDAFCDGIPAPAPRFSITKTAPAPARICGASLVDKWRSERRAERHQP